MPAVWPRRPVVIGAAAAVLTAAVLAVVAALAVSAGGTPHAHSASAHAASLASAGRRQAALEITTGTAVLDVSVARLPGTLLRVSVPEGAPVTPVLSGSAPIVLSLTGRHVSSGPGTAYAVSVVLSSSVRWSLDFAGGTQRIRADLRGGQVGGIAVTAGSDIMQITLPRPAGTLPFLLAGGVTDFQLSLPGGVPARVTAAGGGSYVSVDDQHLTGVAGGTVLTTPGWASAASRFDIDAASGFSRLTVSRW